MGTVDTKAGYEKYMRSTLGSEMGPKLPLLPH